MIPQRYFPNERLCEAQGNELRRLLKDLGWTETDFAQHTQVCINTVNNWVKGHTRVPRLAFLYLYGLKRLNGQSNR